MTDMEHIGELMLDAGAHAEEIEGLTAEELDPLSLAVGYFIGKGLPVLEACRLADMAKHTRSWS